MKLKTFFITFFALAICFTGFSQGPLQSAAIKNLPVKVMASTKYSTSYVPVLMDNSNIYRYSLKNLMDSNYTYKVWTGLITQSSTDAPSVTTLQNNTGATFTWSYSSKGTYVAKSSNLSLLSSTKTYVVISPNVAGTYLYASRASDSTLSVVSYLHAGDTTANGKLTATPFELRVYK